LANFRLGLRGRVVKMVGIILLFLTALYFFLPWGPSVARFGAFHIESANLDISKPSSLYTEVCSKPHDPKKQIVQYALMIDAGSTGSRIHVYKFHNCFEAPTLEHETFEQVKPGLSSYATSPEEAAKSLDALLDVAVAEIPKELQSCTPLAVKATAGLRLLGEAQSRAILEAVEKRIHAKYPFPLPASDGVIIMDGKDEGVYAWITTNYLLGTNGIHFGPDIRQHWRERTQANSSSLRSWRSINTNRL
jgi:Golgi nucleoside diphosphatase